MSRSAGPVDRIITLGNQLGNRPCLRPYSPGSAIRPSGPLPIGNRVSTPSSSHCPPGSSSSRARTGPPLLSRKNARPHSRKCSLYVALRSGSSVAISLRPGHALPHQNCSIDQSAKGGFKHGSNLNGNLCPSRVTSQRKSTPVDFH